MTFAATIRQITSRPQGHIIANRNVWTADGRWILYDVREEETNFSGDRIERVNVQTGEVERLYEAPQDAKCGVPTCCPTDDRYVFIHGPEHPTAQWNDCAWHRRGAVGRISQPNVATNLDAQDFSPPFTPGALRGGTHLHMFSPDGRMVLSTYEDHVLALQSQKSHGHAQANRRVIAVSVLDQHVTVPATHPRNLSGAFTFVVTMVEDSPLPGTDAILRAYSEAWIDNHRIAFLGDVVGRKGIHTELFIATLPPSLLAPSSRPFTSSRRLQGTELTRPETPEGIVIKRLTHTDDRAFPGMQGPRHWAVASPRGDWIGCFLRDASGVAQFWVVSSETGEMRQITSHEFSATSAFTWSPDGEAVAFTADHSIFRVHVSDGSCERLTHRVADGEAPTHHACVYSPDGRWIAYMANVKKNSELFSQIFCIELT